MQATQAAAQSKWNKSLQNLQANQAAAQQHMESNFQTSPILFNSL
jgi:hypothetical protein